MSLQSLVEGLKQTPDDRLGWLAVADCLEEVGETEAAELMRLFVVSRDMEPGSERSARETRIRELLGANVVPRVPGFTNSIGMTFSLIPPGRFLMGASTEDDGTSDEYPHTVEITQPFYMGVTAVTQKQYAAVMGTNPSYFQKKNKEGRGGHLAPPEQLPVEQVTWETAARFCVRLSAKRAEKRARCRYRLPTEAEWEYAARGAGVHSTSFYLGDGWVITTDQANFDGNYPLRKSPAGRYRGHPLPVGSFPPNILGLHDTAGNIWEWCQDWYEASSYRNSPAKDPQGPEEGTSKVMRGGAWGSFGTSCRLANRDHSNPEQKRHIIGFRVVALVG